MEVTRQQIAELYGVAVKTVDNWSTEGMPGSGTTRDLGEVVRWRRARDKHGDGDVSKAELEKEKLRIANEHAELKLREARGELISRPGAEASFTALINSVRSRLEAMPEELASGLPGDQRADFVADAKNKVRLVCKEMESWAEVD